MTGLYIYLNPSISPQFLFKFLTTLLMCSRKLSLGSKNNSGTCNVVYRLCWQWQYYLWGFPTAKSFNFTFQSNYGWVILQGNRFLLRFHHFGFIIDNVFLNGTNKYDFLKSPFFCRRSITKQIISIDERKGRALCYFLRYAGNSRSFFRNLFFIKNKLPSVS